MLELSLAMLELLLAMLELLLAMLELLLAMLELLLAMLKLPLTAYLLFELFGRAPTGRAVRSRFFIRWFRQAQPTHKKSSTPIPHAKKTINKLTINCI